MLPGRQIPLRTDHLLYKQMFGLTFEFRMGSRSNRVAGSLQHVHVPSRWLAEGGGMGQQDRTTKYFHLTKPFRIVSIFFLLNVFIVRSVIRKFRKYFPISW